MHRLAQLQQHVIGDIHGGADAAQAASPQGFSHPQWRLCIGVNATDDPACITRAIHGTFQPDRKFSIDGCGYGVDLEPGIFGIATGRDIAGQSADGQAICPVRCQVDFDDRVIKSKVISYCSADGCITWQLHQAGVVIGKPQFFG